MSLLLRNGHVHTPAHPAATAVLIDGADIRWIGDEDGAGLYADGPVIDLAGAALTPAFVDAHVHATSTGLALTGLDLRGVRSLAEALAAIERAARANRGRPLLGGGWDETDWPERRPPTAAELDRAAYGGLVYLARVDIHSAVVSSSLLAAVPGVAGGPGDRGQGWIGEPAHDLVRETAHRALTTGQRAEAQRAMLRAAAALGIACVHEMAGPIISGERDLADLLALGAEPSLPDVVGYWGELMAVEAARELGAVGAGGDLFCDGSLGSNTAALTQPYVDRPDTSGLLRHTTDQLVEHIDACLAAGLQTGFHAIGDAAVDQVLDAFERVGAARGEPVGAGHRIEHLEYVRDPARLAATGLTASMQPCFDALWGGAHGMYAQRLGAGRARQLNRVGDLAKAGVPLVFGSDSPVTELGPWAAIRAARHPHDPAAALDVRAAFEAHTRAGWRAGGQPAEGVLDVGAPATFAVWAADRIDPDGLPAVDRDGSLPRCRATVLRGHVLHADPELAVLAAAR